MTPVYRSLRKFSHAALLSLLLLLCTGCPIQLEWPLAEKENAIKLDKRLIGTWVCQTDDQELKRVKIERKDNYVLKVTVLEKGWEYAPETDNLEAWLTKIDDALFIVGKAEGDDKYYYHYQLSFDGDKLITNGISLKVGGIDAVKNTNDLRKEVELSMKKEGWGAEKTTWVKL